MFAFSYPLESWDASFRGHLLRHGDKVKDVAFRVDDCVAVFEKAVVADAEVLSRPEKIKIKGWSLRSCNCENVLSWNMLYIC